MFPKYLLAPLAALLLAAAPVIAQAQTGGVGIGTTAPDVSAALDIVSSSKGALLPRVADATTLATPATGLLVFQTGGTAGFYYNAGTPAAPSWQRLATGAAGAGDNLGNHTATQNLNLQGNALVGTGAELPAGVVGVGIRADGGLNLGQSAAGNNSLGYQAGQAITTGTQNVLLGVRAGTAITTGIGNVFSGFESGFANTTGNYNTYSGNSSGFYNTAGNYNVGIGIAAGQGLENGTNTGYYNTFTGSFSGYVNTTGYQNSFVGYGAGSNNTTGYNNTALGIFSGPGGNYPNLNNATAVGAFVELAQSNTVVLGNGANVGIGTPTPSQKLQVTGQIYSSSGGFRFPDNTIQTTAVAAFTANNGLTKTGNNVALGGTLTQATTIAGNFNLGLTGSGNLGVGIATATQKLQVVGQIYSSSGGFRFPDNSVQTTAAVTQPATTASNGLTKTGNDIALGGTLTQETTLATAGNGLSITGDGNVGIGANRNASFKLTVGGSFLTAAAGGDFFVYNNPSVGGTVLLTGLDGRGSAPQQRFFRSGPTNFDVGLNNAGDFVVEGSDTPRLIVQNGGNVGLSTLDPAARLDIQGGANADGTSDPVALAFSYRDGGYRHFLRSRHSAGTDNNALDFYLNTSAASTGSSAPGTGNQQVLTLAGTSAGARVGIGTSTPTQALDVAGTARLRGLTTAGVVTTDADGNLSSVAGTAVFGTDYIQNQTAADQAGGFRVAGSGTVGGTLAANAAVVAGALTGDGASIGRAVGVGVRADGGLNLGQNTMGQNVYLGYQAGQANTVGTENLFVGSGSGVANTAGAQNTFVGNKSGAATTTGSQNTFVGLGSGVVNTTGAGNNFSGTYSGYQNTTGSANQFSGNSSGFSNTTGNDNVFEGGSSGFNNSTGSSNVFLGKLSGQYNETGSFNTVLGANSGFDTNSRGLVNATALGSNILLTTNNTVVLGNNANVGIGTSNPSQKLDVVGNINASGEVRASGVVLTSDQRFKTNIRPLGSALASVLALRGVRYDWNALGVQHGGTAGASQVGVIAQEIEKIYPELVSTGPDGYKAVNYAQLTPVLIEALKEQQAQIEALKQQAAAANTRAASAETKAAQATATLDTFEARLRRLEAGTAQAQR